MGALTLSGCNSNNAPNTGNNTGGNTGSQTGGGTGGVCEVFGFVLERYIYRKVKHLPTGECEMCHKSKEQLLKEYHKCYSQK